MLFEEQSKTALCVVEVHAYLLTVTLLTLIISCLCGEYLTLASTLAAWWCDGSLFLVFALSLFSFPLCSLLRNLIGLSLDGCKLLTSSCLEPLSSEYHADVACHFLYSVVLQCILSVLSMLQYERKLIIDLYVGGRAMPPL